MCSVAEVYTISIHHDLVPWYLIHVLNSDVGGLDPLGHGVAADLVGDTFHGRLQARVGVVRLD